MKKEILVYCEQRDGVLQNVSLELLGIATQLAQQCGQTVSAMLLGYNVKPLAQTLIEYGAEKVYVAEYKCLEKFLTEQYAQAANQIITETQPNIVLFPATSIGRDIAPRLSARLHTGLTADCTKLEADADGNLFMTRPAFGGNLFATIICPDHKPQMSTVRPGVMQKNKPDKSRAGEIVNVKVSFDTTRFAVKLVEEKVEKAQGTDISEAKLLVSIGRGAKNNLKQAKQLADVLGAEVSCSRAVVDEGILPQANQVGQTGKTVRPQLYLAAGISGAVQHLAGMSDSEMIVAINKDKNATIFNVAHLGIVGDANEILPLLTKEVKKLKN